MSKNPPIFNPQTLKRQLGLLLVLGLLYLGGIYLRRDWPKAGDGAGAVEEYGAGAPGSGAPGSGAAGSEAAGSTGAAPAAASMLQQSMAALPLVLTKHGQCRMDCRDISLTEVRAVLWSGRLNLAKSEPDDQPCPAYAVEGRTDDGQEVRIVFAACERETRVVTAIDLGEEHACDCE
jgi:hypothetical protein